MSVTIRVYGHSTDEIVVTGGKLDDIFYDEFLHFNEGTILHVERMYREDYIGKWRIKVVKRGGANVKIVPAKDDILDYTDIATLTGEITGVEAWEYNPPAVHEIFHKITKSEPILSKASPENWLQAWRLITGNSTPPP